MNLIRDRSSGELFLFGATVLGIWLGIWAVILTSVTLAVIAVVMALIALIIFALRDG